MKTATSPIDIWHNEPGLRSLLKRYHIVGERKDGKLYVPCFDCSIQKPNHRPEQRSYPFHHQKMIFTLEVMRGDYKEALETWDERDDSFVCGKENEITVTLCT